MQNWHWILAILSAGWLMVGTEKPSAAAEEQQMERNVVLAVHGGTGRPQNEVTPELRKKYVAGLQAALEAGLGRRRQPGATSLDIVEAAVQVLEDDPLFNAGRGAVLTHDRRIELDASIMEGRTRRAGAVAGVTVVKNPIRAARSVMERSEHVMMIGPGAEAFAREQGLEIVAPEYFRTPERERQLERVLERERAEQQQRSQGGSPPPATEPPQYWGTVGAVAVDAQGDLAAATSTGGMTNKRYGRVGDSPIIGAGTYADNAGCAVSCTGHGEYFIRMAVAHSIVSLVKYKGLSVGDAADEVIQRDLKLSDSEIGEGGAIVLDARGNFAASRNCEGLYRGWVTAKGEITVRLYEE